MCNRVIANAATSRMAVFNGPIRHRGSALNLYDKRDKVETLTLALSTNFLAAVHSKRVAAIGEATKAGNAVYFANSAVIDIATDTVLATAQGRSEFVRRKTPSYPARPTLSRIHSR